MRCEKCREEMNFDYQVEERKVLFRLWSCECGHRHLERINLRMLDETTRMRFAEAY